MNDKKHIINNISPVSASANLNVSADATEALNKVTDSALDVAKPPVKKGSEIVTGLLSFISETIDTGLYIYKENLNYYKEKCHAKIKSKIDSIPQNDLTVPDIGIIGETMECLKYNLDKDYLVELYTNIIAKNVDIKTKNKVHPSYISIIKDLNYSDICFLESLYKIQKADKDSIPIISLTIVADSEKMNRTFKTPRYFIDVDNYTIDIDNFSMILENLVRLNLIEIDLKKWYKDTEVYNNIKNKAEVIYKPTFLGLEMVYKCQCHIDIKEKGILYLTNLGENLLKLCIE